MKRIALISIVVIAAGVGLYFLWTYNNPPPVKAWDLVPEEALIVYPHDKIATGELTDLLTQPFLPDSIRKYVLESHELLISAHIISKEETGLILYLSGSPSVQNKLTASLKSHPGSQERIFEGFTIVETPFEKKIISASMIDAVLVISSASLLIEDVIRLAKSQEKQNFIQDHKALFQFTRSKTDSTGIFLNFSKLPKIINLFLSGNNHNPLFTHFAQSGIVESQKQKLDLRLNGFVFDSLSQGGSILSLFNRQQPVPVTLQQMISNRAGELIHFGITDFTTWNQDRLAYCQQYNPGLGDSLQGLGANHGFNVSRFYQALGKELGICQGGIFSGEIFIVKLKNPVQAMTELKNLERKGANYEPSEDYAHYQIHTLALPTISRTLFWPLANREMKYYLRADTHLIFSDNLEDLKSFVTDLDSENTWGKSSEWNAFLSTSQETNFGIILDALNAWPSLRNSLSPKWQAFGDSTDFLNFNKASFQFSRLEQHYYFNGIIKFNPKRTQSGAAEKEKFLEVALDENINPRISVVLNHINRSSELLIQDHGNDLLLFSPKLKNFFRTRINSPVRSEIRQIDYYKNKKLQYLFATDRSIYLVDRLGNAVKGFPKLIPGNPIQFLSIVDFDNSRNYRFLITDTKGNMTLYDREGKLIPDWKPVSIPGDLTGSPRAVRVGGRDCIFAITREGTAYGFDRKGVPMKGFPVTMKLRPAGNWVLEKSGSQELITVVSGDGIVMQIDLKGKITGRFNLAKSTTSRFSLVPSGDFKQAVISRVDHTKIAVVATDGEAIFERENPGSDELILTYLEGSRGRKFFGFTDPQQEFTYLFDAKGQPLFSRPLENEGMPAIISERSGEVHCYCVNKNRIRSYSLKPGFF